MSSILKALKKLEHEKTGRIPDLMKIDSDILRVNEPSRTATPLVMLLLFFLVFGGGAAVTFFLVKETNAPQVASKLLQAITSETPQSKVAAPLVTSKALPAETPAIRVHKEPSVKASDKQLLKPASSGKTADVIIKKPAKATASEISEKAKVPKNTNSAASSELTFTASVPTLRVNGIAFQNSGTDSLAIVNGVPVSSGSVIEGVTVEEVQKDRVLFQRNREKFEIQLGQSNR